jgi:hypothetical protein
MFFTSSSARSHEAPTFRTAPASRLPTAEWSLGS